MNKATRIIVLAVAASFAVSANSADQQKGSVIMPMMPQIKPATPIAQPVVPVASQSVQSTGQKKTVTENIPDPADKKPPKIEPVKNDIPSKPDDAIKPNKVIAPTVQTPSDGGVKTTVKENKDGSKIYKTVVKPSTASPASPDAGMDQSQGFGFGDASSVMPVMPIDSKSVAAPGQLINPADPVLSGLDHPQQSSDVQSNKPLGDVERKSVMSTMIDAALSKGEQPQSVHEITVEQGVTQFVKIARGFTNRIVTPFANPRLVTTDTVAFEAEGRSIYVATKSTNPVGVFISDQDSDRAVPLTLVPSDIPPREIKLVWAGKAGEPDTQQASEFEMSQPYTETLKATLRMLALGDIPSGFVSTEPRRELVPECKMPGVAMKLGQMIDGHNMRVAVYSATNTTGSKVQFEERACFKKGVLAVAAWPHALLAPGQATEVYVLMRKDPVDRVNTSRRRQSLIGEQ